MINPTLPSPATREAVPLDGQAQKWHDYCLVPVTGLARSLAHDEGFEGADCAEVEAVAERALAHAAASYRPDGLLARPFWSYMLGVVYPALFETLRQLRVRREETAASHGGGGGHSPQPQGPVSPFPV